LLHAAQAWRGPNPVINMGWVDLGFLQDAGQLAGEFCIR
jgi:hypothetical protein